jgi:dipeptidyl aminopeptidase/acylaminoacyl peptidase
MPETAGGANLAWGARDRLVFLAELDGWPHLYSVPASTGPDDSDPALLTPGEYMVEYVEAARGGEYVYYNANTGPDPADDDRRHLFRVPVSGEGAPEPLTSGEGLEYYPTLTGDGETLAHLSAGPRRPPLPAVMPVAGGGSRLLADDRIPDAFPGDELVTPERVVFPSGDGFTIHGQLFRRDGAENRGPAVIFVHGGPPRQMLLGWHYSGYYANAYAVNQYLAGLGFTVLSVNFRLGIGYGWDFRNPARAGAWGASDYTDVLAGARYLRGRPDVDPERIGIWGGSYAGYLTALALARDSDVFAAGVDWHGVHDWTAVYSRYLDSREESYERADLERAKHVMWRSSPVSDMHRWESPVLLIHGDDDRNVRFSETVDLARELGGSGEGR